MAPLWQNLDQALDQLLDAAPESRPALAEELAGEDDDLKSELVSLLPFLEGPPGPIDGGVSKAAEGLFRHLEKELVDAVEERLRRLGPYRLGERLGVGAMGRVYRGSRSDGAFQREVAIKVQRWELADPDLVKRFEREREILAQLDHPAIARLLDGGVTPDGAPYLVMELVEGVPIDVYCRGLQIKERLELFTEVVAAVQAAHSQLIIHRDIKPSNVLVTLEGHVKLLDFGVAKLLDPAQDTGLTETGRTPLTFRYASPEQLLGKNLGVSTDVYSLGILLYQLITDQLPFDKVAPGQVDPRLADVLPPPPSRRRAASSSFDALPRSAVHDLDAIVLKTLATDPGQRYATATDLGRELRRWFEGRPVGASPPSRLDRARKFVRRNRLTTGLAGLAAASLLVGSLVAFLQARRADQQRVIAERIAEFALDTLRQGDPEAGGSATLTARDLLESSADRLSSLTDPAVRARVEAVIGEGLLNLQFYERASELLLSAADSLGFPSQINDASAAILIHAAYAEAGAGNLARALELIGHAISYRETSMPRSQEHARALYVRAFLIARYTARTSPERHEVVDLLKRAIAIERAHSPSGSEALAESIHLLGQQQLSFSTVSDDEAMEPLAAEGLALMREAAELRKRLDHRNGTSHAIESLNDLALAYDERGDAEEAIRLLVEARELAAESLSPNHPTELMVRGNLAAMYREQGNWARAEAIYIDVIDQWRAADLSPSPHFLYGLASVRSHQGQLQEAESLARESLAALDEQTPGYWIVATLVGDVVGRQGRIAEARSLLETCVERIGALHGPDSLRAREARNALVALDVSTGPAP